MLLICNSSLASIYDLVERCYSKQNQIVIVSSRSHQILQTKDEKPVALHAPAFAWMIGEAIRHANQQSVDALIFNIIAIRSNSFRLRIGTIAE